MTNCRRSFSRSNATRKSLNKFVPCWPATFGTNRILTSHKLTGPCRCWTEFHGDRQAPQRNDFHGQRFNGSTTRRNRGPADVFSKQSDGSTVVSQYAKLGITLRYANTDRVNGWAEILHRLVCATWS